MYIFVTQRLNTSAGVLHVNSVQNILFFLHIVKRIWHIYILLANGWEIVFLLGLLLVVAYYFSLSIDRDDSYCIMYPSSHIPLS